MTRLLLYAAQACHELVPPDIVEQLVRVIAQNFVTDRNTPEAITVGLNAVREIFANCPFAATEELLRDLAEVPFSALTSYFFSHSLFNFKILLSLVMDQVSLEGIILASLNLNIPLPS